MDSSILTIQALNKVMRETVEFVHAQGWGACPGLYALVPTDLLGDALPDDDDGPLAAINDQELPEHLEGGTEELGEYISGITWHDSVVGAILVQEITFASPERPSETQRGRLTSGVLRGGIHQTFLQIRPSDEQLRDPSFEDPIEILGGTGVAPGVIAALRYTFDESDL